MIIIALNSWVRVRSPREDHSTNKGHLKHWYFGLDQHAATLHIYIYIYFFVFVFFCSFFFKLFNRSLRFRLLYNWQPLHSLSNSVWWHCTVYLRHSCSASQCLKVSGNWINRKHSHENSVVLKLLKRSSHEGMMQVDSNILVKKSHLRFITISVVKKKQNKTKQKNKKETKTEQNNK